MIIKEVRLFTSFVMSPISLILSLISVILSLILSLRIMYLHTYYIEAISIVLGIPVDIIHL